MTSYSQIDSTLPRTRTKLLIIMTSFSETESTLPRRNKDNRQRHHMTSHGLIESKLYIQKSPDDSLATYSKYNQTSVPVRHYRRHNKSSASLFREMLSAYPCFPAVRTEDAQTQFTCCTAWLINLHVCKTVHCQFMRIAVPHSSLPSIVLKC